MSNALTLHPPLSSQSDILRRVDVAIRLRRAIAQNDLIILKRILKNNPSHLQNPDFSDKSNTSLHLAARHGCVDIVEYLISLGHDASRPSTTDLISWHSVTNLGPSINTDGDTPLHLAASYNRTEVVDLLCSHFSFTINRANKEGATPLHLACRVHHPPSALMSAHSVKISSRPPEDGSTVEALLNHNSDPQAVDNTGNTCLHYASSWGNLKAVRALIQAGADPLQRNHHGWTPQYYSITVQAEVYYKNLVAEWEKRRAEEAIRIKTRRGKAVGGLRLVIDEEDGTRVVLNEDEAQRLYR